MQMDYRPWSLLPPVVLQRIPRTFYPTLALHLVNLVRKTLARASCLASWREAATNSHVALLIFVPRSNKKQIDWDQLDKEVSEELEGEKLEGDAALNKLFKDIYDRADEVCMPPHHSSAATSALRRKVNCSTVAESHCVQFASGHTARDEQIDANKWRHLP